MITILGTGGVHAAESTNEEIIRQATINVSYTRYEWWLLRWSDNQIICHVYIDHEGWPTTDEVLDDCGTAIYNQWIYTQPCTGLDQNQIPTSDCLGLYLFFYGSSPAQKEIVVNLPPSQVMVSLNGCNPIAPENLCPTIP